jgi:hypothetical protein
LNKKLSELVSNILKSPDSLESSPEENKLTSFKNKIEKYKTKRSEWLEGIKHHLKTDFIKSLNSCIIPDILTNELSGLEPLVFQSFVKIREDPIELQSSASNSEVIVGQETIVVESACGEEEKSESFYREVAQYQGKYLEHE